MIHFYCLFCDSYFLKHFGIPFHDFPLTRLIPAQTETWTTGKTNHAQNAVILHYLKTTQQQLCIRIKIRFSSQRSATTTNTYADVNGYIAAFKWLACRFAYNWRSICTKPTMTTPRLRALHHAYDAYDAYWLCCAYTKLAKAFAPAYALTTNMSTSPTNDVYNYIHKYAYKLRRVYNNAHSAYRL